MGRAWESRPALEKIGRGSGNPRGLPGRRGREGRDDSAGWLGGNSGGESGREKVPGGWRGRWPEVFYVSRAKRSL